MQLQRSRYTFNDCSFAFVTAPRQVPTDFNILDLSFVYSYQEGARMGPVCRACWPPATRKRTVCNKKGESPQIPSEENPPQIWE